MFLYSVTSPLLLLLRRSSGKQANQQTHIGTATINQQPANE